MPSRTYVNVDFTGFSGSFTSNLNNTGVATPTGQMNVLITAADNDTQAVTGSILAEHDYVYEMIGALDFDAFPAIPDNALITQVEVRIDTESSGTVDSDVISGEPDPTGAAQFTLLCASTMRTKVFAEGVDLTDLTFTTGGGGSNTQGDAPPHEVNVSFSDADHYTEVQTFDFSGSPITKTALETAFTNWMVQLDGDSSASANVTVLNTLPADSNVDVLTSFRVTGIQIIVTYTSGPEITMTPSGGSIEHGQQVTINGDIDDIVGVIDDLVVRIPFKEVGPNEFVFEIPYPPTDDCTGCIGTCPDCEACATACAEDIDSEACQECMQTCLDCLTTCLENLELAEACQGSAPEGTIVIIVTGTQFSGSVALGSFVILTAEASGIYRLVTGKRNDTLYASTRDGETFDVKIPDPGGKTGFFRS